MHIDIRSGHNSGTQ